MCLRKPVSHLSNKFNSGLLDMFYNLLDHMHKGDAPAASDIKDLSIGERTISDSQQGAYDIVNVDIVPDLSAVPKDLDDLVRHGQFDEPVDDAIFAVFHLLPR